jgi:hypothetical protein
MSRSLEKQYAEVAKVLGAQFQALKNEGFTSAEAVQLLSAILSASHIHIPMAGALESINGGLH